MTYAIYRILYGEDFIQESIKSIDSFVDKIFIFWDNTPWGNVTECNFKGNVIKFPPQFDQVIEKILELNNPKIKLIYDHKENNENQITLLYRQYIKPFYPKPDTLIFIEPDHVIKEGDGPRIIDHMRWHKIQNATTTPLEFWKTKNYIIPIRDRMATIFWDMRNLDDLPDTGRHANGPNLIKLAYRTLNYGFCCNMRTMLWKHLTAIAYSKLIGDSEPNEDWYYKWLFWKYDSELNKDLEISKGYEHLIPKAEPYV